MYPKKILITGGLGFVGSNLAEKFVNLNHEVTLISKSEKKIKNISDFRDKVNLRLMDVRDIQKEVEGFDWIFHFAGTTDNYNIHDNPQIDIDMNCSGTISLLEACHKYNPEVRIIYASTFFVNGNLKELPATPDSPCNPLGIYPASRLAGEHFCKIYNKIKELDTIIMRFTNVFGVKEQKENKKKAGFNYIINLAIQNKEILLYNNGNFVRDYIYISDVVEACLQIAEKGKPGEIYYVGRGEPVKFKCLIDMVIEEAKGGKIRPIEIPAFHKHVGIVDFYCDNTPLKKLGWNSKVSLRKGIKRTINYYKNE